MNPVPVLGVIFADFYCASHARPFFNLVLPVPECGASFHVTGSDLSDAGLGFGDGAAGFDIVGSNFGNVAASCDDIGVIFV